METKKEKGITINITQNQTNSGGNSGNIKRKYVVALLLSIFFGMVGVDRFYLGQVGTGILKFCTMGGAGIWWIIDIFLIATKSVKGVDWV